MATHATLRVILSLVVLVGLVVYHGDASMVCWIPSYSKTDCLSIGKNKNQTVCYPTCIVRMGFYWPVPANSTIDSSALENNIGPSHRTAMVNL